jgi:predicted metal-dependent phosphoesterase TrpH
VEEMARDGGIHIFRGNEITTNQGDILVFGYKENVKGVIMIQELRKRVTSDGGLMIAAHPFRGFLLFGIGQLQMKVEEACQRTLFQYVDGVEIYNGKVTDIENEMARQVADRLGLLAVAGSDAHRIDEVGRGVTILEDPARNEWELIEALRTRRFSTEWHR